MFNTRHLRNQDQICLILFIYTQWNSIKCILSKRLRIMTFCYWFLKCRVLNIIFALFFNFPIFYFYIPFFFFLFLIFLSLHLWISWFLHFPFSSLLWWFHIPITMLLQCYYNNVIYTLCIKDAYTYMVSVRV